jgi:hypothetical protein
MGNRIIDEEGIALEIDRLWDSSLAGWIVAD